MSVQTPAPAPTPSQAYPIPTGPKRRSHALPASVFDYPYRRHLVWQAVKAYLAARRRGTHKTKVRSEVSGTGGNDSEPSAGAASPVYCPVGAA